MKISDWVAGLVRVLSHSLFHDPSKINSFFETKLLTLYIIEGGHPSMIESALVAVHYGLIDQGFIKKSRSVVVTI